MLTRWMIAFHELLHLRKAEELDLLTRLFPLPFSPLNLGYREYREIHIGHHRHTATEQDPDAFHILGGHLKAFVGAVTQHEQATLRYIKANGITRELAFMMVIRLILFMAILAAAPLAFLQFWLVIRITHIINDYVFFHLVHYRADEYATFPIPLPAIIRYPAIVLYGIDVVYATMHHDIHHAYPQVAAKHLPKVAAQISS
jgi:fatty acid desaturase